MIRRDVALPDEAPLWLLISQVHHAQMSGEIARRWHEEFLQEVVEAIAHHDDGWARWESEPKLNPDIGGPYSFLEMPLAESLAIWDESIAAARQFGPLAGYIVASHFYNLLNDSDHAEEGPAIAWLTAKRKVRTAWIDQWLRGDASHTLESAKRSQQMLPLADLFSLWLCCDCPLEENEESLLGQSAMKLRTDALLARFRFSVRQCLTGRSERGGRLSGLIWTVAVEPFPFGETPVHLGVKAVAAPARRYGGWQELVDASWPVDMGWRLVAASEDRPHERPILSDDREKR